MKRFFYSFLLPLLALAFSLHAGEADSAKKNPRKIYAHYMGCFPVGSGALAYHQFYDQAQREGLRHSSRDDQVRRGGRFKTWPLVPKVLTLKEGADLDIRRAIRAGIDGFAIDTWAGGKEAKDTLDALFAAAEAGKYPFEITICIDPWSMDGGSRLDAYKEAVTYLLGKHRDSPNLARRNGKPLILTYQGQGIVAGANTPSLVTLEGVDALIGAYKEVEKAAGQPLFFYFDFSEILQGQTVPKGKQATDVILEAVPKLAGYFGAIGNFLDLNGVTRNKAFMQQMGEAVQANGAEWAPPVWYQYHNISWHTEGVKGSSKLRETWKRAIDQNAGMIQFATWNDYGEHTSLAPTQATNYGIIGINRYYADWWKQGKPPEITEDQLFITFKRSLPAKAYPFAGKGGSKTIEVLALLTAPGKIRVKDEIKDAAAGLTVLEFTAPLGKVEAELLREDKVVQSLEAREQITDRPYMDDPTWYSASTYDEKYWNEDFPGQSYPEDDFYGDKDGDGLPNWFEMYWFGKWRSFSSAIGADANADPDKDGKTNLQEYLERTNPTLVPSDFVPEFPTLELEEKTEIKEDLEI